MNHNEIRFRILHTLYQKYYGGQPAQYHNTDTVIQESGLEGITVEVAQADVIYLKDRHLIEGLSTLGVAHPIQIRITSYGIDAVESITEQAIDELANSSGPSVQTQIEEIRNEPNPSSKTRKSFNYIKEHPDFAASALERIIRTVIASITGTAA